MEEIKKIREKLLYKTNHGSKVFKENDIKKSDEFCKYYKNFLDNSKTEREAVLESLRLAKKKGFEKFDPFKKYKPFQKVYYINKEKAIIFAIIGSKKSTEGIKIAAAHIDSPRLDLKPNPLYELNNFAFFKTHYYGGIKKYQWIAIPLALHGKIIKKNGESINVKIGENENDPQFCITDLLPHLGRDRMQKKVSEIFTGEDLNILAGSRLILNENSSKDSVKLNILSLLNKKYGITEADFLSSEFEVVPAFCARDIGFDRSMIGSYGQDDRVCSYTSLQAIFECEKPSQTIMTILTDKEEVGSDGNTGLNSSFLKYFVEDLAKMDGVKARHIFPKSKCISADVSAAFDPGFASYYEMNNSCFLNKGLVVTKYTGFGGKSGSSDASAEFMAEIRSMLDKNNILWQTGELGKVDGGGGGTVAKYIANLNIDVVDMGVPLLSMHSPFEIVSKIDVYSLFLGTKAFFCY